MTEHATDPRTRVVLQTLANQLVAELDQPGTDPDLQRVRLLALVLQEETQAL